MLTFSIPMNRGMDNDPDRLLYLITLIHNGKKNEVLDIIKEARKSKHCCMFKSGMFSDSYTYIRRWCKREQTGMRIRNTFVFIFNSFVKTRAYALMALSRNNPKETMPRYLECRAFRLWSCDAIMPAYTIVLAEFRCILCIYAIFYILVCFSWTMGSGAKDTLYPFRSTIRQNKRLRLENLCLGFCNHCLYMFIRYNFLGT